MSFERVGIARYARCERLLAAAPDGARRPLGRPARRAARPLGPHADALPPRPAAGLPRGRRCRAAGGSQPGDAAAYRIAVTKLDQDSAEVLMDIAAEVAHDDPRATWFLGEVEDHWRYSQASTVSSGSIEMQRILLSRALLAAADEVILDLSDDAKEYGRQALRAFEAAGGDQLVPAGRGRARRSAKSLVGPVLAELGAWELDPRTDADGLEAAAALCRSAGYWALPYPVAERLAKPDRPRRRRPDRGRRHPPVAAPSPASNLAGRQSTVDGIRSEVDRPRSPAGPAFVAELELSRDRRRRRARRRARAGAAVLDAARHARPGDRADRRAREPAQAVRPAAVVVPGRAVPADRRRGRAQRRGHPGQVRAVEHRHRSARGARRRSGAADVGIEAAEVVFRVCHQLHGAVGSATRPRCRGCRATASRCGGCRSGLSATRDELTRTRRRHAA